MWKLIYSNLTQRPTRTCVCIFAIALGVVMILMSVGLSYGQLMDSANRTQGIGGDFILQPSDASLFFALSSGTLPVKIQEVLLQVEGVEAATPVLAKFIGDKFHLVYGIDRDSFLRVNRTLTLIAGSMFQAPDQVIVDGIYSRSRKADLGSSLELLGSDFTISGIFRAGTGARVLMPLSTLQELNGTPDKATMFFVRARSGESLPELHEKLKARFQHYKITPTEHLHELMTANAPGFKQFLAVIVVISVAVSFLIILLAMYSTIIERTREIGILKSLGAPKSYIVQLILKESLLICGIGVAVGMALTSLTVGAILAAFPGLPVMIPAVWRVAAIAMAIVGGTLGAVYPAVRAAQLDPVAALGYE